MVVNAFTFNVLVHDVLVLAQCFTPSSAYLLLQPSPYSLILGDRQNILNTNLIVPQEIMQMQTTFVSVYETADIKF